MLHTSFADRRSIPHDRDDSRLAAALASGGDRRIRPGADGRNPYFASVLPSDSFAYGSSTISSISAHAFAALAARCRHRLDRPLTGSDSAAGLDGLREPIARWAGASLADILFAASGTALEDVGHRKSTRLNSIH